MNDHQDAACSTLTFIGQTGSPRPAKCKDFWTKGKPLSHSVARMGI